MAGSLLSGLQICSQRRQEVVSAKENDVFVKIRNTACILLSLVRWGSEMMSLEKRVLFSDTIPKQSQVNTLDVGVFPQPRLCVSVGPIKN